MSEKGMFGVAGTGDTSGYGGLERQQASANSSQRPYGSYFDDIADQLERAYPEFNDAIERVVVDRGELTLHIKREKLVEVALVLRNKLRFEVCLGVSGVHYPADTGRELHAVYPLLSMTNNRRIRLEVSVPDSDPHIPSLVEVWAGNNWHERETFDMFGIIFDGHPALTRILMPDDWPGHPQRKDYPLGGIPVEYIGATVPAPDERRSYR
ncbi:MAG: NADH-quinone oxidoreductase subunit C [Actinomycetales bacterium]|jgi:NADH-quinone oxidoreductase subunit C|nr:NADH-quinone oxidoreductase subunit C [Actinomycetales bacterium]